MEIFNQRYDSYNCYAIIIKKFLYDSNLDTLSTWVKYIFLRWSFLDIILQYTKGYYKTTQYASRANSVSANGLAQSLVHS